MGWRFVRKRMLWWPTLWGWALLLAIGLLTLLLVVSLAYPILAPNRRVTADILVVEGWLPDYALEAAGNEFRQHNYQLLITSGGPLWDGHHASGFHSYAALAAHVMERQGFPTNQLRVAPGPKTWRHRTYHSAVAVRETIDALETKLRGINVVTLGPHGRRTHLTFDKVFGTNHAVGIVSLPSADYEPTAWWKTSAGTKHIVTESLAATYEWLFDSGR